MPRTQLRYTQTNKAIEDLNQYSKLAEKFQKIAMPLIKYVNVPLGEHNIVKARVKLLLPPGLGNSSESVRKIANFFELFFLGNFFFLKSTSQACD